MNRMLIALATLALASWSFPGSGFAADKAVKLPPPTQDVHATAGTETAVFAGGCFWGVQAVFQHTKGVLNAVSGYAGGDKSTAHYELVNSGRTGPAPPPLPKCCSPCCLQPGQRLLLRRGSSSTA
jgi:peptide-methionine (S)-S-oxide reductase